jgi:hypothetical protein
MAAKYTKWPQNIPNGREMDPRDIKIPTFSIGRPSKISQIGIFGLKTNHLATLLFGRE